MDLRAHLTNLLDSGDAHVKFDAAIENIPAKLRGIVPKGAAHSAWQLLEHIRIAQSDIFKYVQDPKHKSPKFPDDYWPKNPEPPNDKSWDASVASFRADRDAMAKLVSNDKTDLMAPVKFANNATILGQVLLAADHTAYHVGQIVSLRRQLDSWE